MKARGQASVRGERGFTLLEILVVLAIAGLITAVALPRFGGTLDGLRARSASREVAALLRAARLDAIKERTVVVVAADPATQELRTEVGGRERVLKIEPPLRLVLFTEPRIRFSPRGGADAARVAVSGGGRAFEVAVHPLTGRVSISESTL